MAPLVLFLCPILIFKTVMKNLQDITLDDVKTLLVSKSYKTFTDGKPNIVGIRNASPDADDSFNDLCWVWWTDGGQEVSHSYTITTHPGFTYLQNPIAGTTGTAILVPGQYFDTWELGMHKGKQFALCQNDGPVKVYRDNNKDTILTCDPKTIESGYFGIDLHHGSINDTNVIGPWSAGCQVWRFSGPHEDLMQDLKALSAKYGYSSFSYTLVNQEDFA